MQMFKIYVKHLIVRLQLGMSANVFVLQLLTFLKYSIVLIFTRAIYGIRVKCSRQHIFKIMQSYVCQLTSFNPDSTIIIHNCS